MSANSDIVVYGGSAGCGGTFLLLLEALRHYQNPEFVGVVFCPDRHELMRERGLWQQSCWLYPLVGGRCTSAPTLGRSAALWTFPSGAVVRLVAWPAASGATAAHNGFATQQETGEAIWLDWQQQQATTTTTLARHPTYIAWDGLERFSRKAFDRWLARAEQYYQQQQGVGVRPYVRATVRPDADSWVTQFLAWWIGDDGYPDPTRAGVVWWSLRPVGMVLSNDDGVGFDLEADADGADETELEGSAATGVNATAITRSQRYNILRRDNFKCQICGKSPRDGGGVALEVDHKIPRAKGGSNEPYNLWTLCFDCNRGKQAKELNVLSSPSASPSPAEPVLTTTTIVGDDDPVDNGQHSQGVEGDDDRNTSNGWLWATTREELLRLVEALAPVPGQVLGKTVGVGVGRLAWAGLVGGVATEPKSVTFIPATIWDNPVLLQQDPDYLATLKTLPARERDRLLGNPRVRRGGNWRIRPSEREKETGQQSVEVLVQADGPVLTPEQQQELERCSKDFIYFCCHYCWVAEPRPDVAEPSEAELDLDFEAFYAQLLEAGELSTAALELLWQDLAEVVGSQKPFELWGFQKKAAIWANWLIAKGESGLVEKCRDMGLTWLFMALHVWWWRFRPNYSGALGSRKERMVDNGKMSSLFGKLDYIIEKLPEWLKPRGYVRRKHRTYLSLRNPENGNYLEGDSQTGDFGRSGRHTTVFLDEYAFWDTDVSGSIAQVARTVIYGSSVNGENHFKRLRDRLATRSPSLVQRWEWGLNPYHTQAWFKRMQAILDEADFAREVLIDYQAAIKGKYYPVCALVVQQGRIKPFIEWTPGWPSVCSLDYGVRDHFAAIWWQRNHEATVYRMMYSYTNAGKPIDFYVPILLVCHPDEALMEFDRYTGEPLVDLATGLPQYRQLTREFTYSEYDIEFIQTLRRAGVSSAVEFRGDPAGEARSQDTATSVVQKLALAGIYVSSNHRRNDYHSRRESLTDVLLKLEVNKAGAWPAFDAIQQSKFPTVREGSQSTTAPRAPVHDWTADYRAAAEYYAVGEAPPDENGEVAPGSLIILPVSAGGGY